MRHSNPGKFRLQVQFLRRQFLQDVDFPFTDFLTEAAISLALAAVTGWLDRIFSPWSRCGSSGPGSQRRPLLPRRCRLPDRPPPGARAAPLLGTNRRLLPGTPAPARVVLRRRGLFRWMRLGRQVRAGLAVARAAHVPVRRHDGDDAGHPREPRSTSSSG